MLLTANRGYSPNHNFLEYFKFIASSHKGRNVLLNMVDEPQWKFGYNFTTSCPAEFRQKDKELRQVIIKSLRVWMQPLRDYYPNRKFTDMFIPVLQPDTDDCNESDRSLNKQNVRITFDCRRVGASFAIISIGWGAPELCIRKGDNINRALVVTLMHEMGHAFGLSDTYTRRDLPSTGGLARTAGQQPAALMASTRFEDEDNLDFTIGEDDKNGIIWYYRYLHSDYPFKDCFFPDYVFEDETHGCRPRYPLIFEAHFGAVISVRRILEDDPNLELNGRDSQGNTALHYAVQRGSEEMVKMLVARPGLKVNMMNKDSETPWLLARKLKREHLIKLIEAHPSANLPAEAWDVEAKGKQITTWGEMKRDKR